MDLFFTYKNKNFLIFWLNKSFDSLQVIWKVLYSTTSSKDTGTLYAARNKINAKNVSKDPASNYYGSSELVDKFTKAYIVNAALDHFCMDALEGTPAQNSYSGAIGDSK